MGGKVDQTDGEGNKEEKSTAVSSNEKLFRSRDLGEGRDQKIGEAIPGNFLEEDKIGRVERSWFKKGCLCSPYTKRGD